MSVCVPESGRAPVCVCLCVCLSVCVRTPVCVSLSRHVPVCVRAPLVCGRAPVCTCPSCAPMCTPMSSPPRVSHVPTARCVRWGCEGRCQGCGLAPPARDTASPRGAASVGPGLSLHPLLPSLCSGVTVSAAWLPQPQCPSSRGQKDLPGGLPVGSRRPSAESSGGRGPGPVSRA